LTVPIALPTDDDMLCYLADPVKKPRTLVATTAASSAGPVIKPPSTAPATPASPSVTRAAKSSKAFLKETDKN
jgi:hypothetical protein